jgi:hypothetical protein
MTQALAAAHFVDFPAVRGPEFSLERSGCDERRVE